jgi:hypothetical protein
MTKTATTMRFYCLTILATATCIGAFEMPNLANIFKPPSGGSPLLFNVEKKKAELLEAVSNTDNGKNATPEQQGRVLALVAELEAARPVPDSLLSTPSELKAIDGTWFLQYTSPSQIGDSDEFPVRSICLH